MVKKSKNSRCNSRGTKSNLSWQWLTANGCQVYAALYVIALLLLVVSVFLMGESGHCVKSFAVHPKVSQWD